MVVLGAIMSILDVTVVNVAIKTLAKEFDAPLTTIQWVATGYTLALATVIPLTGWAADRFGTKRLYMTSIVLFLAGSMLSGLAWSAESLIAFRVLQGLGGGMLMPAGMTILTRAAGPQRVGRIMAIIGVPMLLGPIIGPILGGWLVDNASWRWIFFINVPIGAAALFVRGASSPATSRSPPSAWTGSACPALPGLALLIYGLAESSSAGGFARPQVLGPGLRARRWPRSSSTPCARPNALIDLRLFPNRIFSASSATLVARGHRPVRRHAAAAAVPPGRARRVRHGHRPAARPAGPRRDDHDADRGPADRQDGHRPDRPVRPRRSSALAFLGLTQLAARTSYWLRRRDLFVLGLGMGATMMPTFSGAIQTLRRSAIARATTTLNINQQVGASIGTAVLSRAARRTS